MSKYDDLSWLGQAAQASKPEKNNEGNSGYDQSYSEQESAQNVPPQQWEETETPSSEESPSNNWDVQNFFENNHGGNQYGNPFAPQGYEYAPPQYPQDEQTSQPQYPEENNDWQNPQNAQDEHFDRPPYQEEMSSGPNYPSPEESIPEQDASTYGNADNYPYYPDQQEQSDDWSDGVGEYDAQPDSHEDSSRPPQRDDIDDSEDFSALFGDMPKSKPAQQKTPPRNAAPEKSKSQRKLEKTNKKERQTAKKKARANEGQSNFALIFIRILGVVILVAVVLVLSMNRIRNAQELQGSTTSTANTSQVATSNNVLDFYEKDLDTITPDMPITDEDTTPPLTDTDAGYKYIDESMLENKTPTDLAVWYIQEFTEAEVKNEVEYNEFNAWFEQKTKDDSEFAANFQEALVYVNEHPELLHPEIMNEPEEITPDAETPDDETTPEQTGTESGAQTEQPTPSTPDTSTSGGTTTTTPPQTTTTQPSTNSSSDTSQSASQTTTAQLPDLSHMTAAQVANWVYATFPPSESNWDYALLTVYYNWASAKQNSDPSFISSINGYLSIMGWAAD